MPGHDVSPFVRFQLLGRFAAHTGDREKSEALLRQAVDRLQERHGGYATDADMLSPALTVVRDLLADVPPHEPQPVRRLRRSEDPWLRLFVRVPLATVRADLETAM